MSNWLGIVLHDPRPPEKTFEIVEMNQNLKEIKSCIESGFSIA